MSLVWYCKTCGVTDIIISEAVYEDDDVDPKIGERELCINCPSGMSEVMEEETIYPELALP